MNEMINKFLLVVKNFTLEINLKLPGFFQISEITKVATNASLNAKINEVKCEIPSISNLATNAALTTIENKTPNISNLVQKKKKKMIIIQKLLKEKIQLLIMIIAKIILLLQNLTS